MPEYDYTQRAQTKEFSEGHELLYGKRCIKHPSAKLIDGRCNKCDWNAALNKEDEWKEVPPLARLQK